MALYLEGPPAGSSIWVDDVSLVPVEAPAGWMELRCGPARGRSRVLRTVDERNSVGCFFPAIASFQITCRH